MILNKIERVKSWPRHMNVYEIQAFLRFANFYLTFIEGFRRISKPLMDQLKKVAPFVLTEISN